MLSTTFWAAGPTEKLPPVRFNGTRSSKLNSSMRIVFHTRICCFLTLALLGASAGCGNNGLPLVPVHGKVTFAGNPPPMAGMITFMPIAVAEGLPRRPGRAHFDEQGAFQVTSFKDNDGLIPGNYQPSITCWMKQPTSNDPTSFERYNYVPKGFQASEVKVEQDAGSVEVTIDVPKKK